jgi:hypothetical protein
MKLTIEIQDQGILEAIANKFPNAMLTLEEIKNHLECKFADILSYDRDYDWHLENDRYFSSVAELAKDKETDAQDVMYNDEITMREEDLVRYLASV